MHTTLYRKWRPIDFSSVIGQNHITDVLKYEVQNNKTTHAYLFCGSRGTGKTTCAKILAKAINCLSPENGNPCGKC
ncbi:MAG: DNA polymerase III subunit gamma/tau, partial [Clostridia bacterium]|nr:DNA polymerase III subunit gamma/tau [Clostridia bacterium]